MTTDSTKSKISDYLELYQYLSVLTEEQITKLRRVAVGILPISAFTAEELMQLDYKQKSQLA